MTPEIAIERFEVFAAGLDHPECLAFDRDGSLWAGGEAGQVYRIDSQGKVETVAQLGGFCAGLAFSPAGDLFVCNTPLGVVRVKPSGDHSIFAAHMVCPNYLLFAPNGDLYVTDSGHWKKGDGRLLRFRTDGTREAIGGPYGYANGLALNATHLYMVESDTDRVLSLGSGQPEVYAEPVGRLPDGLALDGDGNLYVACYASDEIWRISVRGDKTLWAWDRHAILLSRPTNLVFHGDYVYVANFGRQTITRARVRP